MNKQYCIECGNEIRPAYMGAYYQCCDSLGYWSKERPLPKDSWRKVPVYKGYYCYFGPKWPVGKQPTFPTDA